MEGKKIKQNSGLGTLLVLLYSFVGVFALMMILVVISLITESGIVSLVVFLALVALFVAIPFIFTKSRRKAFDQKLEQEGFTETSRLVDKGRGLFALDANHNRVAFMSYMNPFNIYIFDGRELNDLGSGRITKVNTGGIGFWFTVRGSKKLVFRTFQGSTGGATTGYLLGGVIGAAIGSAIENASKNDAKYQVFLDEAAEWADKIAATGATREVPVVK